MDGPADSPARALQTLNPRRQYDLSFLDGWESNSSSRSSSSAFTPSIQSPTTQDSERGPAANEWIVCNAPLHWTHVVFTAAVILVLGFMTYRFCPFGPCLSRLVLRIPLLIDLLAALFTVTRRFSSSSSSSSSAGQHSPTSSDARSERSTHYLSAPTRPHRHARDPTPAPPPGPSSPSPRPIHLLNTLQPAQIPYRIHTPFSLLAPATWPCRETWGSTPDAHIPVRTTVREGLAQTLPRLGRSLLALAARLATLLYDCILFQRFVLPVFFVVEACTAIRRGEPMRYNWLRVFPRNGQQLGGMFRFDRADPVYAPLFDIYDFWSGWVVGLARVFFFWRVPRFLLRGVRVWLGRVAGGGEWEEGGREGWVSKAGR